MLAFSRNPDKLEAKALTYDQKGKTAKAQKYREKAMKLRQHQATTGAGAGAIPHGTTTTTTTTTTGSAMPWAARTPARYETNATKWEQRGNWTKAQKNREKAWRLNNPQYQSTPAPMFYQNNRFLGYNVPVTGTTTYGAPLSGAAAGGGAGGLFKRNPDKMEQKALMYEQKGKSAKAAKYREKAARLRAHRTQNQGVDGAPWAARPPGRYETNALKWEQRGNWTKAQKNREKVWRMNNPQYVNTNAPAFYQKNQFVGYNAPVTHAVGTTYATATVEHVVRPTIVEQTSRPERIVEVQPIIHRDIEAPQVNIIEKHLYETVPSAGPSTITNTAIVQETVRPRIIEEVQPVVHREVPAPFVERVEQHVTEHIVNPTITTKVVEGGVAPGLAAGVNPNLRKH